MRLQRLMLRFCNAVSMYYGAIYSIYTYYIRRFPPPSNKYSIMRPAVKW